MPEDMKKEESKPKPGILDLEIKMNKGAINTATAFGLTEERRVEVLKKLIAVARIYPKYSIIIESFVNCKDRFTVMERLYGIFVIGKMRGAAGMMKMLKAQITCDAVTMPIEQKLLSLLSKNVLVENKFLMQFMK